MLANSWLYHYYSVQSKIQFGIQYEGPPPPQTPMSATSGGARVPPNTAVAFYHSPNASSSIPSPGYTHPYVTSAGGHPHMPSAYAYHSPVGLGAHHGSPGLVGGGVGGGQHHQHQNHHQHNNNNNSHHSNNGHNGNNGSGNGGEHYRPYAYRIDAVQPVDYSSQPPSGLTPQTTTPTTPSSAAEPRCTSNGSSSGGSNGTNALMPLQQHHQSQHVAAVRSGGASPPPSKRRAIARLEPLYIPADSRLATGAHSGTDEPTILELQPQTLAHSNDGGDVATPIDADNITGTGGATVLLTTVIPPSFGRSARYYPTKSGAGAQLLPGLAAAVSAATMAGGDPTDFMDQWNPSPPWSETAQKVPDVMTQELSPYMTTTTPPTPTSAPPMMATAGASSGAAAASVAASTAVHTYASGPAFSFDWMPEQFVPVMDCGGAVTMAPASAYLSHHHLHQPHNQPHEPQLSQQHHPQQQLQQQHQHQQLQQLHHQQPQQLHLLPQQQQYQQQAPQTQVTVVTVSTTAVPQDPLPPMPVSMHLQMSHWPATIGVSDQRMIGTSSSVGSSSHSSHSGSGSYGHQSLVLDGRHPEEELVGGEYTERGVSRVKLCST